MMQINELLTPLLSKIVSLVEKVRWLEFILKNRILAIHNELLEWLFLKRSEEKIKSRKKEVHRKSLPMVYFISNRHRIRKYEEINFTLGKTGLAV